MSQENYNTEKLDLESLRKENEKLKKQVDELTGNSPSSNDFTFKKAKSLSNFAYWSFSKLNNEFRLSEEAKKFFELPNSTITLNSEEIIKLIYPEDREAVINEWSEKLQSNNYFSFKTRIIISDGSIRHITVKALVERDEKQNPIFLTGTINDETETHYKIEAITKNERLYRSLYNNLTDVFIVFEIVKDKDGNITDYIYKDVNPTFESKFKLQKNDIINKKLSLQTSIFQQFHPLLMLTAITNQPQQDRLFIQMLDCFFDVLIYTTTDNTLATIWRDVSLMVEADSSLRESEEKYRQIFSIGSDSMFMVELATGKILDVNPTACRMFGHTKDVLMKMKLKHLFVTDESFEKQMLEQKTFIANETCRKQDETIFPVEVSLSYFNWSGRKTAVTSIRDISERIIAQEDLIKSEQKFKHLFDESNDAILILKNYRIIDYNKKASSLFKFENDLLLNKTIWNLSPSKQGEGDDTRTKAIENIQNSLLGNQLQFEWIFQKSDQSKFVADIKLSPISYENEKVVQAIIRDISNQKESQNALKNKEERWKQALEISSVGVWDWNIQTNEVYFSTEWKNILGFEKNEIQNKFDEFEKRIHPNDIALVYNKIDEFLTSKINTYSIDYRMRCKNGTFKWIRAHGKILSFNADGKPERFICTHLDITKQKTYEEKLLTQKNELSIASEISKLGYWELDIKSMIMTGSANSFMIFGYEGIEQLSMRQIEIFVHPEDRKNFISQFISNNKTSNTEIIFRAIINGQTKYILSKSRPSKNPENILISYKGIFQDITAIKEEEVKIREEQNLTKAFVENLPQSIEVVQNETILFANEKFSELTGFSSAEINSNNITPFHVAVPEDRITIRKICDSVQENSLGTKKIEVRIETKNSRIKWVELSVSTFMFKESKTFLYILTDITQKKTSEIELVTNENRFRSVVAHSSLGVALFTENGDLFYYNNSFQKSFEVNGKNQHHRDFYSYLNDNDSTEIKNNIESLKSKTISSFNREIRLKNDSQSWIYIVIRPAFKASNEIDYLIVTSKNIEDEKLLIKALETNNKIQSTILSNLTEGYAIFDMKFNLKECNQKFIELTKLEHKELTGTQLSKIKLFSKVNTDTLATILRDNNNTSLELYPSEDQIINADIIQVKIMDEINYLTFVTDITESKKELETIVNQNEKYRNIVEGSPLGIALIDRNRQIIYSNTKYAQTFGYTTTNLLFKKIDDFANTENLSELISKFSQLFTGILPSFNLSQQMNDKNGETLWINSNFSSMKDKYGDITSAIQIIDDITELKENEKITLTNERIQTIKDIANYYAFNLSKITDSLYGNTYIIKNKILKTESKFLTDKFTSIAELANILANRLIVFSDNKKLISTIADINELINNAINSCNIPSSIQMDLSLDIKLEHIVCDTFQMKNAIQNIVENAIEAMPQGGKISIKTSNVYFDEQENDKDNEIKKGKYLRIIISDTGMGIKPNNLQDIFVPYFTTKQYDRHPGLGLSFSQKIIEQLNGTIKIFSTVNEGTNINLYIPESEFITKKYIVEPDEKIVLHGSSNVLLIDDEEIVRSITTKILSDLGHDVFSFSDHIKAIQFFKSNLNSIDYIVIDKQMQDIDGEVLYNILWSINPKIKVILMDSNTENNYDNFIKRKNNRIIYKPISAEKIFEVISDLSNI